MTRINCVPVEELSRLHAFAEYREMPRLRHAKITTSDNLPKQYKMGTGHCKFFYDKGKYLEKRHKQLKRVLQRKFNYQDLSIPNLKLNWPKENMKDWQPDRKAKEINRKRIAERLKNECFKNN